VINKNYLNKEFKSPFDYLKAQQDIEGGEYKDLKSLNITYMSTYTAQILEPYIVTEMAKRGYKSSLYFPEYNNFEQEILNKKSFFYLSEPDILIIHFRIEDIDENLSNNFSIFSESELKDKQTKILSRIKSIMEMLSESFDGNVIIYNFAFTESLSISISDSMLPYTRERFISELNYKLTSFCKKIPSCQIFDFFQTVNFVGITNWVDFKMLHLARIPFSVDSQITISKVLSKTIVATREAPCKCLILDLDNTLWGGILGEDGVTGIHFGNDYPGSAFKRFQQSIIELYNQGVLLAISSKNDEKIVKDAFSKRDDFIIKINHFSSLKINWKNKADNILEISKELNIGLNSIVFFDDSNYERGLVREMLPDVNIVDVPENFIDYPSALANHEFFDYLLLTDEDKRRNNYYISDKRRSRLSKKAKSIDDFLANLQMKVVIGEANEATLSRISQLTLKTNQFTTTTRRYSVADIEKMIKEGAIVSWLSVEDIYGDSGIIGVAIATNKEVNNWYIDTFLLSCRALGRKLEIVLLSNLLEKIKLKQGALVFGEYIESEKNNQVSMFYDHNGFDQVSENLWQKELNSWVSNLPNFIELRVL
jgi:FkbH-like protein